MLCTQTVFEVLMRNKFCSRKREIREATTIPAKAEIVLSEKHNDRQWYVKFAHTYLRDYVLKNLFNLNTKDK